MTANTENIGGSGSGVFTQSGGTNSIYTGGTLWVGGTGTYQLSGTAQLSSTTETVGGVFTQSGGSNSVSGSLDVGATSGGAGSYSLGGTGQLSAAGEYIANTSGVVATIQQTGGVNAAAYLAIGSGGTYRLSGGTLQINGSGW